MWFNPSAFFPPQFPMHQRCAGCFNERFPPHLHHFPHHSSINPSPPWQDVSRGYIHDNYYPQPLLLEQDNPYNLTPELQRLAVPSAELAKSVGCVASACTDSTQTLEGQQACQCASLNLACQLGGDELDPASQTFCAALASGGTMCESLNPNLIGGFAVTAAPHILNTCFA